MEAYPEISEDSTGIAGADAIDDYMSVLCDADDTIEIRCVSIDKDPETGKADAKKDWIIAREVHTRLPWCRNWNKLNYNVWFGANPRPGFGISGDGNIKTAWCLFADFDGKTLTEALARVKAAGLPPPSMIINSGHGIHMYWRFAERFADMITWEERMKDLAALLGSDTKVCNPERMMRPPGFMNPKPPAAPCEMIECSGAVYEFSDVMPYIPVIKRDEVKGTPATPLVNGTAQAFRKCLRAVLGMEMTDGADGSNRLLAVCCRAVDFNLSDDHAIRLVHEAHRLQPFPRAWSDEEILKRVRDAEKRAVRGVKADTTELVDPVALTDPIPPAMPDGIFSGWLGDMISGVADATETPPELAASAALAVVASTVQGRVCVMPEKGYFEQLSIYAASFLPSGSRKSAVTTKMSKPLLDHERRAAAELGPKIKELTAEKKTKEMQVKKLREKAVATGDTSFSVQAKEIEASIVDVPVPPRYFVQDITPENLAIMMAQHGERMLVISDEGGLFDTLIGGRYQNGVVNVDLVLQAFTGVFVRCDRVGRASIQLNHPALSIFVSPQPCVATGLAEKPELRNRGCLSRFLFTAPKSNLGERTLDPRPIDYRIEHEYAEHLKNLLDIQSPEEAGREGPHVLRLCNSAYQTWKEYQRAIERMMQKGGRLENLTDIGGKWPGMCARLAGLLHIADFGDTAIQNPEIDNNVMVRAVLLADFFLEHGLAVFGLMGADKGLIIARRLWSEIEKLGQLSFTAREAWLPTRGTFKSIADVEPGFRALIDRGWLLEAAEDDRRGPGRPSRRYTVNPRAVVDSAHFAQLRIGGNT